MEKLLVKFCPVSRPGVEQKIPAKATAGSAGFDLTAAIPEKITIPVGGCAAVPSGVAVGLPENTVGLVFARSGLATKSGVGLANAVGVIDSDYTGEILVSLRNYSEKPYVVEPGERVAQLVVLPCPVVETEVVETLAETARSSGGFGSTGRF